MQGLGGQGGQNLLPLIMKMMIMMTKYTLTSAAGKKAEWMKCLSIRLRPVLKPFMGPRQGWLLERKEQLSC